MDCRSLRPPKVPKDLEHAYSKPEHSSWCLSPPRPNAYFPESSPEMRWSDLALQSSHGARCWLSPALHLLNAVLHSWSPVLHWSTGALHWLFPILRWTIATLHWLFQVLRGRTGAPRWQSPTPGLTGANLR